MSMSPCLKGYLDKNAIPYLVIHHTPTDTAYNAARSAHIPTKCMVKGVLLQDKQGYLVAAVASTQALDIEQLNRQTGRELSLVAEENLLDVFSDCAFGAVPALGEAYGIPTLWDEALLLQPSFYIEAGNHDALIRLGHYDFIKLMSAQNRFCLSH